MHQPYFSVIIPALNEEAYIGKLLTDLVKQSEKDFDVVIIDGNSTDKTCAVAEKYSVKLPLKIFSVKKRNVSYQRNFGASKRFGKYLVFMDADSRIEKDFLKKIKGHVSKKPHLVIVPRVEPHKDELDTVDKYLFNFLNSMVEMSQYTTKPFSSGGSMVVERNFFNLLGGFNEKLFLAEDHELVHRARQGGVKAAVFKDICVNISLRRIHKEGRLTVFLKHGTSLLHSLRSKDVGVKKHLFDYEMGGTQYNLLEENHQSLDERIKAFLKKVKETF